MKTNEKNKIAFRMILNILNKKEISILTEK